MSSPASSGSQQQPSMGWAVSRGVLYFGLASLLVVWASASACLICHCLRRRRRAHAANAESGTAGAATPHSDIEGAAQCFPTTLPVVIVNPDNTSLELGIKEEPQGWLKGGGDSAMEGAPGDGKEAGTSPAESSSAVATLHRALRRDSRGFMTWPQQQQRSQEKAPWQQQQSTITLGQAKVWVPGEEEEEQQAGPGTASFNGDDGASCSGRSGGGSGSSSGGSSSGDARKAWGYQAPT